MMRILNGDDALAVTKRSEAMSPDGLLPDRGWLSAQGARAVAQPSGTSLEDDFLDSYVEAVSLLGCSGLVLVSRDPDVGPEVALCCELTPSDLRAAAGRLFGLAFCLMPADAAIPAVIVTTADYRIVLDVPSSLPALVGPVDEARDQFREWCADPNPVLRRLLGDAAELMDWIGSSGDGS